MKPAAYHLLSVAEKFQHAAAQLREPTTRCPQCSVEVMPIDLLPHLERCPGPPAPTRAYRWLQFKQATALVARATLSAWVQRGVVRVAGRAKRRRFLERDIVVALAHRRIARGRLR